MQWVRINSAAFRYYCSIIFYFSCYSFSLFSLQFRFSFLVTFFSPNIFFPFFPAVVSSLNRFQSKFTFAPTVIMDWVMNQLFSNKIIWLQMIAVKIEQSFVEWSKPLLKWMSWTSFLMNLRAKFKIVELPLELLLVNIRWNRFSSRKICFRQQIL